MIVMKLNDVNMNVRNILFLLYENRCSTLLLLLLYCNILLSLLLSLFFLAPASTKPAGYEINVRIKEN